jgi:hypothetical protein
MKCWERDWAMTSTKYNDLSIFLFKELLFSGKYKNFNTDDACEVAIWIEKHKLYSVHKIAVRVRKRKRLNNLKQRHVSVIKYIIASEMGHYHYFRGEK